MNFAESENYLLSLGNEVLAMKLGLEAMRRLLGELGDPQSAYLKVQVAGTNGKGSVCAFLDSILREAGISRGVFTSPHLVSVTERVRIDGVDISEEDFARLATRVRSVSEHLVADGELDAIPTFFEQVTAIALLAFAEAAVEVAILETGLGGRLDATTAAGAEVAAITRIDLDHQEYLGDTIEKIAAEKAAIIHADSRAVVLRQEPSVNSVLVARCSDVGVEPRWVEARGYGPAGLGEMHGRHQGENASVAVGVAEALTELGVGINAAHVSVGLMAARHPGRLEYAGRYLFDGAHNVGGAKALAEYLAGNAAGPITLIFGAMREKNIGEILSILSPLAEKIVITEPSNSRAAAYDELLDLLPDASKENVFATASAEGALRIAEVVTPGDGIIVVTGSLYLIGEVKKLIGP